MLGAFASGGRGFTTKWTVAGNNANRTITLPLVQSRAEGNLGYNFTVDWGDGNTSTVTSYNDSNASHLYALDGTYVVEIRGQMEGWSFNGAGDFTKFTSIEDWGHTKFKGFKYLRGGFKQCHLVSLPSGGIPASGTGILSEGFYNTFNGCTSLTTIPGDIFRYNTAVSTGGFAYTFNGCTSLTTIPVDIFKYNTAVSNNGFDTAFAGCTSLTTIPVDIFRYNTLLSSNGFYNTFNGCSSLTTIPVNIFRYNILVVSSGFHQTFSNCNKLQLNRNIFFADGEESTRFLNQSPDFARCFQRSSFTGTQGTAPDLWACNYGTGTPVITQCFNGNGNSLTSLDNYASIPANWE
jgi:hypothetical protein